MLLTRTVTRDVRKLAEFFTFALLLGTTAILASIRVRQHNTGPVSPAPAGRNHTYLGRDYPQEWPLDLGPPVHMSFSDSVHYALDTDLGRAEWNASLPSGGALVRLGAQHRPFTVGMFHQVRCLDILREIYAEYYADVSPDAKVPRPKMARHCLNYIRQMVLCRSDLRLENARTDKGNRKAESEVTHTCRDWSVVYDAAEENYKEYLRGTRQASEFA